MMNADKAKKRYISRRAGIVFGLMCALTVALLAMLAVLAAGRRQLLWMPLAGVLLFGALIFFAYRLVYIPYRESVKVFRLFSSGYLLQSVFDQRWPIDPAVEQALDKFREIINIGETLNSSKRQAQYLALQNQINPHFLYNTLEGIRGETMNAGLENVSNMTEALATFFRYTISNVENLVALEDELTNIENYYIIQRYRFGERLSLVVEYDHEEEARVMRCRLPKLTLQPIVENAVYHGIERKLGKGVIRIKIETTPKRLIITVSDNGLGIENDMLAELNNKLNSAALLYAAQSGGQSTGGIAMLNVNSRIQLLFGEDYGLHVYSTPGDGTDVEITLPLTEKVMEGIL